MNWKFTKTWLTVSGLLVHAASFAGATFLTPNNNQTLLSSTEEDGRSRSMESRVSALEQKRGGLLNPPARPVVEDFDFNFFGDLLIWQANENGLPIAVKNKATSFTPGGAGNLQNSSVQHLDCDYDVGFRLGIDFDTTKDGWDVSLTWLRFDSDADKTIVVDGNKELFASRLSPAIPAFLNQNGVSPAPFPVFSEARSRWKAYLNQLDLDLGREFFVSKFLTLRPHFGLRTTWLRQRLKTEYSEGISIAGSSIMPDTESHEKNKWWGLGIEGGLDTQWILGNGISLYGNLAAAIEYGFQKVRTKQEVEGLELLFENNKDSYRVSRPILDFQLGIRWDRGFNNDAYNFGLHAGWEHHVYFSQNQFHVDEFVGNFVANQGDMTYQGWTLGAHLAF